MNYKTQSILSEILVRSGEKKALMEIFKVSHVTIREALRGNITTPLAMKIRTAALKRGGREGSYSTPPVSPQQNKASKPERILEPAAD